MFEWMYIPQSPSIAALIRGTSGGVPRRKMTENSIVWLMSISKECEREPESQ